MRYLCSLCLAPGLASCATSRPANDVELALGNGSLSIELSRDLVLSLVGEGLNTTFDCNGELDGDIRALLEPLERRRYATTSLGHGNDRVIARRRGSQLTLVFGQTDAGHLTATVPWAVAQCLLGEQTTLEQALGTRPITASLETDDGKVLTATLR